MRTHFVEYFGVNDLHYPIILFFFLQFQIEPELFDNDYFDQELKIKHADWVLKYHYSLD